MDPVENGGDRVGAEGKMRGRALSVRTLAVSLVVIAMFAAAPFVIANVVSERRIAAARLRAAEMADLLRSRARMEAGTQVLLGEGDTPRSPEDSPWRTAATRPLAAGPVTTDPWRNAYVVNIGSPGPVWVLSAGPNGILETPFDGAALQGDDIVARVQ